MAYGVYLPGRWKRQPQGAVGVDYSRVGRVNSVFAPGLYLSADPVFSGSWSGVPVVDGARGAFIGGTASITGAASISRLGATQGTIVVVAYDSVSSSGGTGRYLFDSDTARHALYRGSGNTIAFFVQGAEISGASTWTANEPLFIVARYSSVATTTRAIYRRGRLVASGTASLSSSGFGANLNIGQRTGGSDKWGGHIQLVALLPDVGDAHAAQLSENPWQLFRPLRPILYSFPSAAAAPTLSAATVIDIASTSAKPRVTVTFS